MERIGDHLARPRNPRTKDFNPILVPRNSSRKTQSSTAAMAKYLADKFDSPEYINFFLKVSWKLDETLIIRLVEESFRRGTRTGARAYFIKCAKNEKDYTK